MWYAMTPSSASFMRADRSFRKAVYSLAERFFNYIAIKNEEKLVGRSKYLNITRIYRSIDNDYIFLF